MSATTTKAAGAHWPRIRLIVGVLLLLVVGECAAWMIARDHRSSTSSQVRVTSGAAGRAVAVQPAQLRRLVTQLGRALYWIGPRPDMTYELTRTPDGRVYVRYLPPGVHVGTVRPFLTVGTYPLENAYAITRSVSKQPGSVPITVPGGVAFYSVSKPTSVYVAFRGVDDQIEVFDPSASRVRAVVVRGLVRAAA
jgi:hypothetical protein